jgi:hypothetical protein
MTNIDRRALLTRGAIGGAAMQEGASLALALFFGVTKKEAPRRN